MLVRKNIINNNYFCYKLRAEQLQPGFRPMLRLRLHSRCFNTLFILMTLLAFDKSELGAQTIINWQTLSEVSFEDQYQQESGTVFAVADFSKNVQKLAGKKVQLIGYLLPMDVRGKLYALSANPFATCFFCGKSGPESVMELELIRTESWFAIDRLVLIRGVLELNSSNPQRLYYILKEAEVLERMDK